jgi:hypothetical protein
MDGASGRIGRWTEAEDSKLKDSVQTHYGKDWDAISALVPSRTKMQCISRWHDALKPGIALAAGRTGKCAEDEDSKLKDALQTYGSKDWAVIAALVPGRTRNQCRSRWQAILHPSINQVNVRKGKWGEDEDSKLRDVVQTHGGKNWDAISASVPGRTKKQCHKRWYHMS